MIDRSIKTLIFDLGGVILDLSVNHTLKAFSSLSGLEKEQVKQIYHQSPDFNRYEKGEMTDAQFRNFIRQSYLETATDQQIDDCWNAMLLGIPLDNLQLLKRLMKSYQVILLSNTNNIHLNHINQVIMPAVSGDDSLTPFFNRTYYSYLMHMRKPDAEIFEWVLKENNLAVAETLFLDDNKMNIEGAEALGIKTIHVPSSDFIVEYFHA